MDIYKKKGAGSIPVLASPVWRLHALGHGAKSGKRPT